MSAPLTNQEIRLMYDVSLVGYAYLNGEPCERLTRLCAEGFMKWEWNGGVPMYSIAEKGHEAIKAALAKVPK